jgi:gliding motility-associated lipoprotein GldH
MTDHILKIFLLLLIGFAITSCRQGMVYHNNKSIPSGVWDQDSLVKFTVNIDDTVSPLDFYLNLRHTTDYRYSNIYFFVETLFPSGQYSKDTIEFILADKRGEWYGKGFGSIKEFRVLLRKGIRFPAKGEYRFIFEQAMREEELKGIEDIGITLEKQ